MTNLDEILLRKAFALAVKARDLGDHPFGAVLTNAEGEVLMEQANGYSSEGGDRTAHAERLLASRAAKAYGANYLASCTLYSSAEPCALAPSIGPVSEEWCLAKLKKI